MSMETQTQTPAGEKQERKRVPKYRCPVMLGVTHPVHKRLRQRARQEGMPLAMWLRRLAIKELSRKPTI